MRDGGSPTLPGTTRRPRAATTRATDAGTTAERPTSDLSGAHTELIPTASIGRAGAAGSDGLMVLGRYRLARRLGAGGFGTVWLARDERLDRDVAIKLLPRERIVSGRFEREARATARLNHPGIVVLYEAAVDDEGGYLVSELVRGRTFAHLLQNGHLSDRDIVLAGIALCDALDYAHRQGVVHRDVKPSNVLVPDAPSTAAEVAKLTDFGVAHVVGGDSLTRTGDVVGTTTYMAPEQAEGRQVAASADLYSLSLLTYEGLTGVNPLRLARPAGRGRRLGTYLPPVRRYRRDLPRELSCAVDLALRPRAAERGTVQELRHALASALDQVEDLPGSVTPMRPSGSARPDREFSEPEPLAGRDDPARGPPGRSMAPTSSSAGVRGEEPWVGQPLTAGWLWRVAAALAASLSTAWFASTVLSPQALLPMLAIAAAGVVVALLPRIGWLTLVLVGAVALVDQDSTGGAVLLLLAALPPVVLLLGRPTRWPLPAIVPALAVIGLAGAWPALAGRAPTAWQRFVLGAAGWAWLSIGVLLGGGGDYAHVAPGTPAPRLWIPSPGDAIHQVLHPLLSSGLLVPGFVWAGGAVVFPLVFGGRSMLARVGRAMVWAMCVTTVTYGLLVAAAPGVTLRLGPALAGVVACVLVGMFPGTLRRGHPTDPRAGLA